MEIIEELLQSWELFDGNIDSSLETCRNFLDNPLSSDYNDATPFPSLSSAQVKELLKQVSKLQEDIDSVRSPSLVLIVAMTLSTVISRKDDIGKLSSLFSSFASIRRCSLNSWIRNTSSVVFYAWSYCLWNSEQHCRVDGPVHRQQHIQRRIEAARDDEKNQRNFQESKQV